MLSRKGESIDVIRERLNSCKTAEQSKKCVRKIPNCPRGRTIYTAIYRPLLKEIYGLIPLKWKSMQGKADITAATDPSIDYVIDIVLSGKTAKKVGLGIEAVLFMSDGVIVANDKAEKFMEKTRALKLVCKTTVLNNKCGG